MNERDFTQAIDAALLALGELHATIEAAAKGKGCATDERARELAGLIWRGIDQNVQESDLGTVNLPAYTVSRLLHGISRLQVENSHLRRAEENRMEMWRILDEAQKAFNDPRLKNRAQQNQAAMNVLGFTRRSGNNGEYWLWEYQNLVEGHDYDPSTQTMTIPQSRTQALEILAGKYGKSEAAMYQALNRAKRESDSITIKLPPNPSNTTKR